MNKNLIIILVLVALLLLGGIAYAMRGSTKMESVEETSIQDTSEVTKLEDDKEDMSITGNLLDLINKGSNLQCTFSGKTNDTETSGTTFISGKKVRGDYNIVVEGKVMESHLISDSEYMYSWTSAMPQGLKMKIDELEKTANDVTDKDNQQKNLEAFKDNYDYKCTKWNVDDAMFEVPSNIQFTDYSAMMKNIPTNTNNLCATCDMIQEAEGKAACKAQLNCK